MFENVEFHFGGLNPNAAEDDAASEVEFATSGDDTVTASFTSSSGDSTTLEWAFDTNPADAGFGLQDSDQNSYVLVEGAAVQEDEYFFSDAGDFSHLWQITDLDPDSTDSNIGSGDEATVDLKDVVTGSTITADLDAADPVDNPDNFGDGDDVYQGEEVIGY